MCTKQDQESERGIQLPISHTLSDRHICHGVRPLGSHVKNWSFYRAACNADAV